MHNWSGNYDNTNPRSGIKTSCGRPFAPEITIRAGGKEENISDGSCCQTLGPPKKRKVFWVT